MLDIVTFKWRPAPGYRSKFSAKHVNIMRAMCARNYSKDLRFTCITDDAEGIDPRIRVIPLWDELSGLQSPHGPKNPSCYRRLKIWSNGARENIGERILQIDLDMVIVDDMSSVWDRQEDVVLWADNLNKTTPYNGAMQLLRAGSRANVWDSFDHETPQKSINAARRAGYFGSDQAWLSYVLGPNEARWRASDGCVSYRVHCLPHGGRLPRGAKIVNFHGQVDPWKLTDSVDWIGEHYRE